VFLVEQDDVVQAFPAEGANQAFDHWNLPRRSGGNEFLFQAKALDPAHEIRAVDALLMDQNRGREVARHNGLTVAGALGELLRTRQIGLVFDLRNELSRLRSEAGFFVDAEIEAFILSQVGE